MCATRGRRERRALYAARAGEAGAGLRRLQPAVAVDPGKAASKLKYAETQYEANKQIAPGLLKPVKGVKAYKPKDASIDKVFCNPPRLRAPGILGGTMEDWSVIFKCGAQDGIRGICKAIWCGTMTDGVKGIICDVRACAFYKDPLCTEGPSARIRPIAIGCTLRRLCCKAGTCDLAPEWNRFYTTMHPDDAAEWEADICSAEAALFACEAGGGPCGGGPPDKQAREKKLYTGLIRASRKSQSSWAAGHKGQGTEEGLL